MAWEIVFSPDPNQPTAGNTTAKWMVDDAEISRYSRRVDSEDGTDISNFTSEAQSQLITQLSINAAATTARGTIQTAFDNL